MTIASDRDNADYIYIVVGHNFSYSATAFFDNLNEWWVAPLPQKGGLEAVQILPSSILHLFTWTPS